MSYVPPGVTKEALNTGTHSVTLVDLKEITDPGKLQKFSAQAVFVATFKSLANAIEIDHIIKFNGSKSDFYAGQNIDRLFLAAGLPTPTPGEPIDVPALTVALSGVELLLEVNDRGYAQTILVPMASTGTSDDVAF